MRLKLQEVIDILQDEIIWCLDHPDKELSQDAQLGFINGLRQAQYIIRIAENVIRMTPIQNFVGSEVKKEK